MKTVLVVDNNVGFLFWLGKTLENAGYNVVPGTSIAGARALMAKVRFTPDLLIVNPAISGVTEFVANLRRDHGRLQVMAVIEENATYEELALAGVMVVGRKPPSLLQSKDGSPEGVLGPEVGPSLSAFRSEWLQLVRAALGQKMANAE